MWHEGAILIPTKEGKTVVHYWAKVYDEEIASAEKILAAYREQTAKGNIAAIETQRIATMVYQLRKSRADLILAPIGLVLCDAMLGEVTGGMALAVGGSPAHKILVPVSRCGVTIAGAPAMTLAEGVSKAVEQAVLFVNGSET